MNHKDRLDLFRSSHRRCSVKMSDLRNFENFTKKRLCWSLFWSLSVLEFLGVEIFKNTYFKENLQKTAFICFTSIYYSK